MSPSAHTPTTARHHLVVVGSGMVSHRFIESFVASPAAASYRVTVFSEEPRLAYDRVHLSEYFNGRSADDLALARPHQYNEWGIEQRIGDAVAAIDTETKQLTTASGEVLTFDKLVLATGSYPFVPPIPGGDAEGCLVYRTLEDLDAITAAADSAKVGVVVGGGLLGLEAANALKHLGLETHVVEFAPQLMAVQIDGDGGRLLKNKIEALGVQVHTSKNTQQITPGKTHKLHMAFADGDALETDLILFSAGIRPRDELARHAGLALGERGGIAINDACQTSHPDIYAIGECALWQNRIFGLVAPGYQMAQVASAHLNAEVGQFGGADMSTKLKLLGVDVGSIGDAHGKTPGAQNYSYCDEKTGVYKKLVVDAEGKALLGAVLVGDCASYDTLLQYYLNGIELPEYPDTLLLPDRGDNAAPALGPDALPAAAQICSCYDVSKGAITAAVQEGAHTMADLKAQTRASTGCGGCTALVTQVMNAELANLGVEVNTDLCEHFPYTRQELYHLVRVGKITTFEQMIEQHGRGHGCDICKPAVASILASCWNQHIMEPRLTPLQDSNDYFMANLQKDGTYSVVPRIPGGEITPDKLIVIGEVARDFNLYTKITGGARIDLFGARVEQLPAIWERLVAAGFESGHAYGKALRTVKSCVGSTWCRYGVDDSMAMGIRLEERYRGLRAPHKLKMGVSGCTRECAEAQGKDIGVIATENGWNLYVCGNGGMKPRHADLFATDLDDATLIRYIDRVLMFYIRTADRLQRTSVWMNNMEGGLDYLYDVVVNDSLGIAEQLEAEMQANVDVHQCEWKATLSNPEKLQRFRQFVNSDESDDNVVFVNERQQIRPATATEKAADRIDAVELA